MPNIVKAYGVHLVDDVVKIKDVTLHRPKTKKPKPKPVAQPIEAPEGMEEGMEGEGFEPFEAGQTAEMPAGEDPAAEEGFGQDEYDEDGSDEDGSDEFEGGYSSGVREEIIQSAMAEAGKILQDAIRDAEAERQQILSGIEAEAQEIRRQAEEQGRQEGLLVSQEETRNIAKQVEQMIAVFEGERAGFEYEYEEQLKWMAFEIASKVLAKKIADNDAEMVEMVDKAVQGVRNEPWVRVEVSGEMTHLIERLMALYGGSENIAVQPVHTDPGSVMIETPAGVIDASLKTQLENLRDYFAKFGNPAS